MAITRNTNASVARIAAFAAAFVLIFSVGSFAAEPNEPVTVPENRWTKIADCPADPLGRELQPGRGAFWAYEPIGRTFVRYGGFTPTDDNSLWRFDMATRTWSNPVEVDYSWPPPADRPGAGAWWSMAWDPGREVIWMYGGFGIAGRHHTDLFTDIWKYDPATGTFEAMRSQQRPRGYWPEPVRIVYDSKNDLVIRAPYYSGEWNFRHNRGRTWVYDPKTNTWEGRQTDPMPGNIAAGGFAFDRGVGKAVYVSLDERGGPAVAWTYDAAANQWEKIEADPAPESRAYPGFAYDPGNGVCILYGGVGGSPGWGGYLHRGTGHLTNDTWALDVAEKRWTKLDVASPGVLELPGQRHWREALRVAMDYDPVHKAVVVSAPTFGVWALRYRPADADPLDEITLPPIEPQEPGPDPVFPVFEKAEPNPKLVNLEPGEWIELGGGRALGGGEVPLIYDQKTGFALKYGGCNNQGTTFASGYGNDLSAYDPAAERWIALRWVDPGGPPRPTNACTMFYGHDPDGGVNWFASGTAGNRLASSNPIGWEGGSGTWSYDGEKDRFVLVPSQTEDRVRVWPGVVCAFSRHNRRLITVNKVQERATLAFDVETRTWTRLSNEGHVRSYIYGTYVDPLKALFIVETDRETNTCTTWAVDTDTGEWRDLKPEGDLPVEAAVSRSVSAYDNDNNIVLLVGGGSMYVYHVEANTWEKLDIEPPAISEMMIYDTRHKVFLGCQRSGSMYAFRYR